ncbi:hypothetical protein KP509_08G031000 [Ceratopteris richardii]|uniref:Uncharacterized protein n=1 Tax=Ceratopteris richardii TaxID=49495 RepID=A0A8T2U8W8_CERRI|nr:hypothetical protein KP509_08G031000 [Ceratopteris richardii]
MRQSTAMERGWCNWCNQQQKENEYGINLSCGHGGRENSFLNLSVRTVDAVPLQTSTASLMKVYQTDGHDSATSISVVHDKLAIVVQRSECNNSAIQVSLSSANNCSLVGNASDSTENCCRLSRLGFPSDLHRYCKYVDIKESCKRHVFVRAYVFICDYKVV